MKQLEELIETMNKRRISLEHSIKQSEGRLDEVLNLIHFANDALQKIKGEAKGEKKGGAK